MVRNSADLTALDPMAGARKRDLKPEDDRRTPAARLAVARQQFVAEIKRGLGGRAAHARFSDRVDDLIRQVVAAALSGAARNQAAEAAAPPSVAVAALGGYGRRTLCLHSDIDLLVVFGHRIGEPEERFLKAVLHPLWDLGLTVGHQVRALSEAVEIEADNPEFLLSQLDARFLAGDALVFEQVDRRLPGLGRDIREEAIAALLRLTEERHAAYNDTIHQLEPDVKESPGGLRDIVAAQLLASLADDPASLDEDALEQAENFLLRVRSLLHLEARRNANVLSHELQEKAAERLRFDGGDPHQRVEALMSRYFVHGRVVARALGRAINRATPTPIFATVPDVAPNLRVTASGVEFVEPEKAANEPATWLAAFEVALDRGIPVGDNALSLIERRGGRYALVDFLPTTSDRQRVVRLLRPRQGLYARLSEMHDCGLLGRLLPGFSKISSRVIRDFYHKYTVDEHTLLTVRGLERLLAYQHGPGNGRFAGLLSELHTPEYLVLALLFHDVGKWKEDNHAEESVRMAQVMLDQYEVPSDARHDVEFLIGQHLQMSQVTFRRDNEDPQVIRQFAALVGTDERLKMLTLLTLVDIGAVSPTTLTPWKEDLLWRVYVETYNELTLAYGDEVIEQGEAAVAALLASRPPDLTEHELTRFLEGFPRRYLTVVDPAHVYQHARLARDIHRDEVHLFFEQKGEVWELAVVTLDKSQLFSNICGTLSYFGMDILRGSAMTSQVGLVLDTFQFSDQEGFFRCNADGQTQFERLLGAVVAGHEDISARLARKERGPMHRRGPGRVTPIVHFDNEESDGYTVLEIVAQDALGLLHRVSRVISNHGCDVDLVLISTEGNKAIDVFHLTQSAAKLPRSVQTSLRDDLERMLQEG
jgi:[protein-PII] uridylyltransferase